METSVKEDVRKTEHERLGLTPETVEINLKINAVRHTEHIQITISWFKMYETDAGRVVIA